MRALGFAVLAVIGAVLVTALYIVGQIISDYFKGK
jgi:hypothetical protein